MNPSAAENEYFPWQIISANLNVASNRPRQCPTLFLVRPQQGYFWFLIQEVIKNSKHASPVLINSNLSASDENSNVKTEDVIFHGANFNRLLSECEGNSA